MPPTKVGVVALKADTGNYLARCNGCVPGGAYIDNATIHVTPAALPSSPWAKFEMWALDSGLYAFKADSGNYLARCNKCIPNGRYPDSLFVHVTEAQMLGSPWAQFQVIRLGEKMYLKSDNGLFVARVTNGIPGASCPDAAFVSVQFPDPVTAADAAQHPEAGWSLEIQS